MNPENDTARINGGRGARFHKLRKKNGNNNKLIIMIKIIAPQGFGPEAKPRGGTLGFPACIHIRNFKM